MLNEELACMPYDSVHTWQLRQGRTGAELEALAASGYLDSMKATEH